MHALGFCSLPAMKSAAAVASVGSTHLRDSRSPEGNSVVLLFSNAAEMHSLTYDSVFSFGRNTLTVASFGAQHMVCCISQLQHGSAHQACSGWSAQYPHEP